MKTENEAKRVKKRLEAPPPVEDRNRDSIFSVYEEQGSVPQNKTSLWQNPKVVKLISWLLSEKDIKMVPEISLEGKDGFAYREADDAMETSGKATAAILESLTEEGILIREEFERILLSPGGSVQLLPVERCPNCDSKSLSEGKMIEHFVCGYVGLEEDFMSGLKTVCPKCKKELKLIGTDYRIPGMRYTCRNCGGIFPLPTIKCRCLKTGETFKLEELRHIWLYSYRLNEAHRKRLEFELEPKKRFVDCLHNLGYDVQESVRLQGKSGATHTVDLLATMDDPIVNHAVAIGILAAPQGEEEVTIDSLFSFDSKIYDIGINYKIVLAVPRLASEAAKFAERQGIRVYGIEELEGLASGQNDVSEIVVDKKKSDSDGDIGLPELSKLGPKGCVKRLLERKGYLVTEDARLSGRSGAEHVIEIYAQKDDGIVNHRLAACVINSGDNPEDLTNEVVQFDTAAYDVGISKKVIISVPYLSKAAKQYAEYQRIKVLEAEDLEDFSKKYLTPEQGPAAHTVNT